MIRLDGMHAVSVPGAATAAPPGGAEAWKVGALVQVRVVRGARPGGTATLRIGALEIDATTTLALDTGARLSARVERLGSSPLLRVLADGSAPAGPRGEAIDRALRRVLPRARDLAPALRRMLASGPPRTSLGAALDQVASLLPSRSAVATAEGLRTALRDSGLLLEARLAERAAAATPTARGATLRDLKASLLRLVGALRAASPDPEQRPGASVHDDGAGDPGGAENRPASRSAPALPPTSGRYPGATGGRAPRPGAAHPPQPAPRAVLDAGEGALARIEHNQLRSLPAPGGDPVAAWHFELGIDGGRDIEPLELLVERRRSSAGGGGGGGARARWSVSLDTEIEDLGPLHARIWLDGDTASVTLWAERAESARALDAALPRLERSLSAAGLRPAALSCRAGRPRPETPPRRARALLEVEA